MSRLPRQMEALTRELEALEGRGALVAHELKDGDLILHDSPCDERCQRSAEDPNSAPETAHDATAPAPTTKTSAGGSSKRRKPIDPKKAKEP
jgi:hypothetical protein